MALLFEYWDRVEISSHATLEPILVDIWQKRTVFGTILDFWETDVNDGDIVDFKAHPLNQPFLKFEEGGIKANNYVGFIQHGEEIIEIFPKVFRHITDAHNLKPLMLRHIFYWFQYCTRLNFPFNQVTLDARDIDNYPELILRLIANQFFEVVSNQPYSRYYPVEEGLQNPKGSINFKRYAVNSLGKGNFHKLECDHEPFLFDNQVNQAIKFCTRLMLFQTKEAETQRVLMDILFVLDEVEVTYCTSQDLEKITINSFFTDYKALLDSCKLLLNQQLYSTNSFHLTNWCLLFPMEFLFEDFVAGFMEQKFSKEWLVKKQSSKMNLSNEPEAFQMKHDIILENKTNPGLKIIVDTKYKLRNPNFKSDPKKGISQSDLYQMVSYAFKTGCTNILLLYPNTSEEPQEYDRYIIDSGFLAKDRVTVYAMELPFWSQFGFEGLDGKLFGALKGVLGAISGAYFNGECKKYCIQGWATANI